MMRQFFGSRAASALTWGALLVVLGAVACGPSGPAGTPRGEDASRSGRVEKRSRPLVILIRVEPASVAGRSLLQAGTSLHVPRRIFNALLALIDDNALPRLDLGESLPQLNTDTWIVFPDGRMETTYRIKPGLTWHDGAPLTAEDFVFSWRVYSSPELGQSSVPPMHAIDEVTARDAHTFVVRWRLPYPGADHLSSRDRELPPLPRHVLRETFEQQSSDVFSTHPFWTREYIGVGPYRIESWEPGSSIDAVAFDNYALGRPKIDRILLRFATDSNTALANLLSGEAQAATDNSIGQVVDAIKGEYVQKMGGRLIHWPNAWRHTSVQIRPELANPRAILDVRVRRALAYAVDRPSLNDAVLAGDGLIADTMIWSKSEWGAATTGPIVSYQYDVRRSEQLMNEAGFFKGADGTFSSPTGGRFTASLGTTAATDFEQEMLILADTWRKAGFEIQEFVLPAAQAQDPQARATFSALFTSNTNLGEAAMLNFISSQIPSAPNRWRGGNRGGWADPEYDRIAEEFNRTVERPTRVSQVALMLKMYSEELPAISLFFRAQPLAHVATLRGPATAAPESSMIWNVQEWEWQ